MSELTEKPTSANAEGVFEPFHISRVPCEEFSRGERFGMRYQHLSSFGGGSQISVAMEVLPPGKQANQLHYHMLEEEHVFVIEGSLTLTLGAKTYELFPESDRVEVKLTGESYRKSATLKYWEGVD